MSDHNGKQRKSLFDWLTILAAWVGVGLGVWTAYLQYTDSKIQPDVAYGHWGAKYQLEDAEANLAHFRSILSNRGDAPATDVRVKLWDVPKDAEIWCSLDHEIVERTETTALIKVDLIPPRMNGFLTIRPFDPSTLKTMPYIPSVYSTTGNIKREKMLDDWAKTEILEHLAKLDGYKSGVSGWHRTWDEPVTTEDIEWGACHFTIEDR